MLILSVKFSRLGWSVPAFAELITISSFTAAVRTNNFDLLFSDISEAGIGQLSANAVLCLRRDLYWQGRDEAARPSS